MDTTTHPTYTHPIPEDGPPLTMTESIIWERIMYGGTEVADIDEAIRVLVSGMLLRWGIMCDRDEIEIKIKARHCTEGITFPGRARKRLNLNNIVAHIGGIKDTIVASSGETPEDHIMFLRGNRESPVQRERRNVFSLLIVQDDDKEMYG